MPRYSWRGAAAASLLTDGGLGLMMWLILLWLRQKVKHATAITPGVLQIQGS
jgi:hypothetical protein